MFINKICRNKTRRLWRRINKPETVAIPTLCLTQIKCRKKVVGLDLDFSSLNRNEIFFSSGHSACGSRRTDGSLELRLQRMLLNCFTKLSQTFTNLFLNSSKLFSKFSEKRDLYDMFTNRSRRQCCLTFRGIQSATRIHGYSLR